jgi:hypothetical protein
MTRNTGVLTAKRPRVGREKRTVTAMMQQYCHDLRTTNGELCLQRGTLHDYAILPAKLVRRR